MDKQQKTKPTLKDKKNDKILDITAFSVMTALMLFLATSFYQDTKTYPDDPTMKILVGICASAACIAGGKLVSDVKKYNDIKKELAQRTNEKQK